MIGKAGFRGMGPTFAQIFSPHDTTWKYIIDDILRNTSHRLEVKSGLTEMEQTFYIQLFTFLLSSVGRVADS